MMLHMSMSQKAADKLKGYISDPFLKAELRGKCTRVVVTIEELQGKGGGTKEMIKKRGLFSNFSNCRP